MNIQNTLADKNVLKENDFDISITNEHDDQDLTSIGEPGKSYGIMSIMNLPRLNFSITNKKKLYNRQLYTNDNRDNFSTHTSLKKMKNDEATINDEIYEEVINIKFIFLVQKIIIDFRKERKREKENK